jgi:hypothetical protein
VAHGFFRDFAVAAQSVEAVVFGFDGGAAQPCPRLRVGG